MSAQNSRLKIFELQEANSLLPRLEELLSQWEKKHQSFRRFQDHLFFEELMADALPSDDGWQELEKLLGTLEEEMAKIHGLGCHLRHAERGMVDFLSRRGEEWVYYCWRRGEKEIQYYHGLKGGFFERRPLAAVI